MLDLILKLLEHLRELLKLRAATNLAIFADHIEPIYGDIKLVYDDYVAAFEKTRDSLHDVGTSLQAIIDDLKAKRKQNQRLRQELLAYSEAFQSSARFPEEFSTFCFYSSQVVLKAPTNLDVPLGPMTTQMGPFIEFLERWADADYRESFRTDRESGDAATEMDFRTFAGGCLEGTLSNMANDWRMVMKSYFELRIKYLKPA